MERAKTNCANINRITWTDDTLYITYQSKVYNFPNHRLCSLLGLDACLPVHAGYMVQEISDRQVVAFLRVDKVSSIAR